MKRCCRFYMIVIAFAGCLSSKSLAQDNFHDELLDHFIGTWQLAGTVNGEQSTVTLTSEWVMNHQWLRIHELGPGNMPGKNYPYEGEFYLGYNNSRKCYVRFLMNVFGGDDPASVMYTGSRKGNEITLSSDSSQGTVYIERLIWEPDKGSWHLISLTQKSGNKPVPYLDMWATRKK